MERVTEREQRRLLIPNDVERRHVSVREAAGRLNVSIRQVRRVLAAYREEGGGGTRTRQSRTGSSQQDGCSDPNTDRGVSPNNLCRIQPRAYKRAIGQTRRHRSESFCSAGDPTGCRSPGGTHETGTDTSQTEGALLSAGNAPTDGWESPCLAGRTRADADAHCRDR